MGMNSYGEAWHVQLPDATDANLDRSTLFYLESELELIDRVLGYAFDAFLRSMSNNPLTPDECQRGIRLIQDLYGSRDGSRDRILCQMYPPESIKHCLPEDNDKSETKEETNG